MAVLRERIETALPIDEAFAFVADFANAAAWDPGVASAERIDDGALGVGARYRLGVRMGGRIAPCRCLGLVSLRNSVPVAVPALLFHRVALPRGL